MKRRRQVRRITVPHRPRRTPTGGSTPSICLGCGEPIDRDAVLHAIATGERMYILHDCGRVLHQAFGQDLR